MSDNITHWLETAYSRICAGEAEANVLRDYGLIREEAFTIGVEHLRQENERLRGLIRHILGDRITPEAYLLYGKAWVDEAHAALAAPRPEPVRHPGYVIGSHWLETAYSRICAGEAEADVLRDCGWERVTDAEALRLDAERYRWMKREVKRIPPSWGLVGWDAAIDAAMQEVPR